MELVQELARTPIRQSEAGSTGQAGTKRAAAAVSMTCRQLQTQPVDMRSLREAPVRDASRKVRLAKGQCSDQMGRPGAPGPCGGCSPTKQGSGTSVTAACSAHSGATGCSKHHPSSTGDDVVRGLVEQAIEVTLLSLRHFFVTAGMQLGGARESIEDAGALPHSALVSISQLWESSLTRFVLAIWAKLRNLVLTGCPAPWRPAPTFQSGKGAIIMSFASWASLLPRQVGLSRVCTASHLVACSA